MVILLSFFFISLLFIKAQSLSCTTLNDCKTVTKNKEFVSCVNSICVCKVSTGFSGNATTSSKCDCPNPSKVFHVSGIAYCSSNEDTAALINQKTFADKMYDSVWLLFTSYIFPNPSTIIEAYKNNQPHPFFDLFAPNATGRFDPSGEFYGKASIIEYLLGAIASVVNRVTDIEFSVIGTDGARKVAFVRVQLNYSVYPDGVNFEQQYFLEYSGVIQYNDNANISGMEFITHNIGKLLDDGTHTPNTTEFRTSTCQGIIFGASCNSSNDPSGFYSNVTDCVTFMTESIPFGTWTDLRQSSVICRFFHFLLALIDPVVHCPHSGILFNFNNI